MIFDSENWQELQRLFALVEASAPEDRERLLAESCPDEQLRERVMDLVRAAEAPADPAEPEDPTPTPYRILRLIGSGGMGTVYLAERALGAAKQQVAWKVLAPHALGPQFVERFRREQQILALLNHPDIARFLDAGITDTGAPYLVMEYVEGVHLDAYCNARTLDPPSRIRLFQRVCAVVDYAHRNLVVHLDLKPSNILVTGGGEVKLLDFGTARLLQPDGTGAATIVATPSYASPEQLRNEPPTTASDIYSLGVILFELLTGKRPSDTTNPDVPSESVTANAAAQRAITEGRLRLLLNGDIKTIIGKCLAKTPGERYASVHALADDLDRYLDNRPILARPQTTLYGIAKYVRRNRGRLALAMALTLAILGALGYAWGQQRRALREAQRAVRLQTFMSRLFNTADPGIEGRPDPTVKQFLETGSLVVDRFLPDKEDLRQAQLVLAAALYSNQDLAPARRLSEAALASARASRDKSAEAEALATLGQVAFAEGRNPEAKQNLTQAVSIVNTVGVSGELRFLVIQRYTLIGGDLGLPVPEMRNMLARAVEEARHLDVPPNEMAEAFYYLASCDLSVGDMKNAEEEYLESLRYYVQDPMGRCYGAEKSTGLADFRREQARYREGAEILGRAYPIELECFGNTVYTLNVEARWADQLALSGEVDRALGMLEKARPEWMKPPVNKSVAYQNLRYLANAYVLARRFGDAEQVLIEAENLFGKDLPKTNRRRVAMDLLRAQALMGLNRRQEALPYAREAAEQYRQAPVTPLRKVYFETAESIVAQVEARPAK
jgi:tetratricopeptide (TPR) repeat protein